MYFPVNFTKKRRNVLLKMKYFKNETSIEKKPHTTFSETFDF